MSMSRKGLQYKKGLIALFSCAVTLSTLVYMFTIHEMVWNSNERVHSIYQQRLYAATAPPLNITTDVDSLKITEDRSGNISLGGRYKPSTFVSRHRVAVIVPYRDREIHLKLFLNHMHPYLQRQQIDYGIFVVESIAGIRFNRGLLLNVGFIEASKLYEYNCFVFHDVDMLPEYDGIKYTCDKSPLHLSSAMDKWNYKLRYQDYFGGVCAISKRHFKAINGFSNIYFGWGAEDDDIRNRLTYNDLNLNRLPSWLGRYKTLEHKQAKENPDKSLLLKTSTMRHLTDGLNSLKYHIVEQKRTHLYTWILVGVNETEILESEPILKHKNTSTTLTSSATLIFIFLLCILIFMKTRFLFKVYQAQ